MCTREMTLGEEIINLTKRGIDVPTVERMYRKYIDLDEKGKSEGCYAIDKPVILCLRTAGNILYSSLSIHFFRSD